jgi:transposase
MLGRQESGQGQFFYSFDLDRVVPPDHLVRQIDGLLDLSWVHNELLAPFYSHTGRPSIDPVLMIRMLIVGYVFALRSERRLCAEVQVNLAYRWFCKLGIEDHIPDHSVFCRARRERFRESDALRRVFERVVALCISAGLVGGEAFSVDASLIKADVNKTRLGDSPATSLLPGQRRRKHPMRFASTSQRLMRPIAIRTVMKTATVQVKAAFDASLPRKSRSPIRKQHGLRGRA